MALVSNRAREQGSSNYVRVKPSHSATCCCRSFFLLCYMAAALMNLLIICSFPSFRGPSNTKLTTYFCFYAVSLINVFNQHLRFLIPLTNKSRNSLPALIFLYVYLSVCFFLFIYFCLSYFLIYLFIYFLSSSNMVYFMEGVLLGHLLS